MKGMHFALRRRDKRPRTMIRRLVRAGNRPLLLEVCNIAIGLFVNVHKYDADGWDAGRFNWSEPGPLRTKRYLGAGGHATLGSAIAEAAEIDGEEAERIALDTLLSWEGHVSEKDAAAGRLAIRVFVVLLVTVALLVVGFLALLGIVLARMV